MDEFSLREIGAEALWFLSTAKPGNGVDKLRDDNLGTFWQSDGPQPHYMNIQFQKIMNISEVKLYVSYKEDESYTPSTISLRIGTGLHDLKEIEFMELVKPEGWISFKLGNAGRGGGGGGGGGDANNPNASSGLGSSPGGNNSSTNNPHATTPGTPGREENGGESIVDYIRTHFIQIAVKANHQNGRDTHVRLVKIFGPRPINQPLITGSLPFRTVAMRQFACIR